MQRTLSDSEFKTYLQNELTRRCRANARYSLRSFARTISMDPSSVSQLLAGKRRASPKMIARICEKIGWPDDEAGREAGDYFLVSQDCFAAISEWYHYALLDLTLLKGFKNDPAWIARRLGITHAEAKMAIERLLRLEMLVERNGKLSKTKKHFSNYLPGQTSSSHREYQRQILRKGLAAVDDCAADLKDITAITIAANTRKLELAREKIRRFRRELCAFLEDGEGDSVHVLAVQLFPLTKNEN